MTDYRDRIDPLITAVWLTVITFCVAFWIFAPLFLKGWL